MQNHVKVYHDYFGYYYGEFFLCECCQREKAVDIHHIIYRSKFGAKRKDEQDLITNLIGLCRKCHDKAHSEELTKEYLTNIHNFKLKHNEI